MSALHHFTPNPRELAADIRWDCLKTRHGARRWVRFIRNTRPRGRQRCSEWRLLLDAALMAQSADDCFVAGDLDQAAKHAHGAEVVFASVCD